MGEFKDYSTFSRALGAMLACERWYHDAAAEILRAIYKANGNAVHAATELGVAWRTLRNWCETYPELQRALTDARMRYVQRKTAEKARDKRRPRFV